MNSKNRISKSEEGGLTLMPWFTKEKKISLEVLLEDPPTDEKSRVNNIHTSQNSKLIREKIRSWIKDNRLVLFIWILALALRIISAILSKGYIHPDEHYQSIEVVFNKIYGFGFVPWEFTEGARSWFYPGIVYIIFKVMIFFGASSIDSILIGVRLFSGLLSMISVIVAYYFGKLIFNKEAGLFATFFIAVWYDFIFWATRTMTDGLAMNFVFLATYLIYKGANTIINDTSDTKKQKRQSVGCFIFAGMSIGVAFMFKFPAAIIALPLLIYLVIKKKWIGMFVFCFSILFIVIIQGLIDLFTWGTFLHSAIVFFNYNITSGSSSLHGTAPIYAYLGLFAYTYSFFALMYLLYLVIGTNKNKKAFFLIVISLFFVLVFSVIEHKEYRFILPILPLFVLIAANGMNRYPQFIKKKNLRKSVHVFTTLFIIFSSASIGFFDASFRPNYNYCQTFDYVKNHEEITTVILIRENIFNTPGYAYLGSELHIDIISWSKIDKVYSEFKNSSICFIMTEEIFDNRPWIGLTFQKNNISCVFSSIGIMKHKEAKLCIYQKNN